jgi:predicted  nucleic acid-binding Zn-ribbon protein
MTIQENINELESKLQNIDYEISLLKNKLADVTTEKIGITESLLKEKEALRVFNLMYPKMI